MEIREDEKYSAPQVRSLGSVEEMTQAFDKIGSDPDIFTPAVPQLDGDIIED